MIDVGRPAYRGWCHSCAGGLSCIRKGAEQARGSKPVSSVPLCSLLVFLPPGSCHEFPPLMVASDLSKQQTVNLGNMHLVTMNISESTEAKDIKYRNFADIYIYAFCIRYMLYI